MAYFGHLRDDLYTTVLDRGTLQCVKTSRFDGVNNGAVGDVCGGHAV